MAMIQILSTTPALDFNCGPLSTVKNHGPERVYYRNRAPVTASVNDGSIASGGSASLSGPQWFFVPASRAALGITATAVAADVFISAAEPQAPSGSLWVKDTGDGVDLYEM